MMPRRRSRSEVWDAAHKTAERLHDRDEKAEEVAQRERTQGTTLPLEQILDRETDTRPLKSQHVTQLAESIAVLGLIEPLVVDSRGRLLAGGHRQAAIAYIRENNPQVYAQHFPDDLVPVRMMPFDADEDPEQALQVEISENEKRRDYTPNEVRALAERLRAAGYVDTPGRPSLGEKRLRPALEVIVGKSLRSVRRYLTEEKPVQHGQVSKKTALRQAKRALAQWASLVDEEKNTRTEKQLVQKLPQLLELIEKAITEG
jgi:ParB family transcriptional regulator, chromosome partitioning protein